MSIINWTEILKSPSKQPKETISKELCLPNSKDGLEIDVFGEDENLMAQMDFYELDPERIHFSLKEKYLIISGRTKNQDNDSEDSFFERIVSLPKVAKKVVIKATLDMTGKLTAAA